MHILVSVVVVDVVIYAWWREGTCSPPFAATSLLSNINSPENVNGEQIARSWGNLASQFMP